MFPQVINSSVAVYLLTAHVAVGAYAGSECAGLRKPPKIRQFSQSSMQLIQAWQGRLRTSSQAAKLSHPSPGATFFDGWSFFTQPDPTKGSVSYVDKSVAFNEGLVTLTPANTTIMRVDNVTALPAGTD